MADIFVSYKKEDAGRVVRIVEGLRAEGFTVWWDHGIAPGDQWDQTIQSELDACKAVVAVWSELSVSAPWVKEEASVGKNRNALVPVRIDNVNPPLGFGLIQMADLIKWDGDIEDPHWDFFIEAVRGVINGEDVAALEKPAPKHKKSLMPLLLSGVIAVALTLGAGYYFVTQLKPASDTLETSVTTPTDASPQSASAAETELFEKAQESGLKAEYLDYLRVYANGAYADTIRNDILPFCSYEQRDIWKPQSTQQSLVGVSAERSELGADAPDFETEAAACEAAKANVTARADQLCRMLTTNTKGRNGEMNLEWNPCQCEFIVTTWVCKVEPVYGCAWEFKTFENIEVCKP